MQETNHDRPANVSPEEANARRRAFFSNRLLGKDRPGDVTTGEGSRPGTAAPAAREHAPSILSGQAHAQLTFRFGIASVQLTPFFRLDSLELTSLSNVVSLDLVAARGAESSLAAAVSFQIDRVELDGPRIRSLLLKPLDETRPATASLSSLRVNEVRVTNEGGAPITVTSADQEGATVQLLGTFAVTGIDFTPTFEVGLLQLEPVSNTVRLRGAPSGRPAGQLDLPPSFDLAEVRLGGDAQFGTVRLVPGVGRSA